jgi:hypothetical protein
VPAPFVERVAVDREVKPRAISHASLPVEKEADRPDLALFQRLLDADLNRRECTIVFVTLFKNALSTLERHSNIARDGHSMLSATIFIGVKVEPWPM